MSDYSQYLDFTREIAFKSGKVLNNYFGNIKSINKKTASIDLVTEADLHSEKILIDKIQKNIQNTLLSQKRVI